MTENQSTGHAARTTVPGSGRAALPAAEAAGDLDRDARISVTVVLRRQAELPADVVTGSATLSRAELAERYGAGAEDITAVRSVAGQAGLSVDEVDAGSRRVRLSGTIAAFSELFGTSLTSVRSTRPGGGSTVEHRHRTGELSVPAELAGRVVAVLGLDDRPQSRAQSRIAAAADVQTSYTPLQLGEVYAFPGGTDGTGQALAIIELGGGYQPADLATYFAGLGVTAPTVTDVEVDGGTNGGGTDPQGADGEVLLDIEVAGALAPAAAISVYFAPNTDAGFLDAVSQAAHADPTPTAISISWGGPEDSWTEQARSAFDSACADGAALGVTILSASGDNGSSDGESSGVHVDFPSASPHVLACGGTTLTSDGSTASNETVWGGSAGGGATGGGVSTTFDQPSWQAAAGVPARADGGTGRGVPDVAGDADPATGYRVFIDGSEQVIGGTSAVAPLWAALVCRLAQQAGQRLGLLQPALYAGIAPGTAVPGLRDITEGSNGDYSAGPGWDACTGLGVPIGADLVARVSSS